MALFVINFMNLPQGDDWLPLGNHEWTYFLPLLPNVRTTIGQLETQSINSLEVKGYTFTDGKGTGPSCEIFTFKNLSSPLLECNNCRSILGKFYNKSDIL